ncbi:alpha/beta hydrolase [Shewanella surugensis]|uniref:Lysophospholipase n=1 Tax=Shewanella surugensis TaxID=212020 RepID=A0ABT0LIK8_9GAMM|nr:alpha/beta hydrolase [Shewanella surugensis]MCL1126966.1 lysophospholipase [Shewanella surugensis]
MMLSPFELSFQEHVLKGDCYPDSCDTLVMHGAGQSSRARFVKLRQALFSRGVSSAAFDFMGHGETGGQLSESSLAHREAQALAVIKTINMKSTRLIGSSMSAYTAIKLTALIEVQQLVLLVPGIYTPAARNVRFGPVFSNIIRVENSWYDSDAFDTLQQFKGDIVIVAAEQDQVIPLPLVERLYAAASQAQSRVLSIIPNASHLNLFPTQQDFEQTLDVICGGKEG